MQKRFGYILQIILSEIHRREDRQPIVINSRPPELLQPFTCDVKSGFHTGNLELFVKNLGNIEATSVFGFFWTEVIPENKRGDPSIDEPAPLNCEMKTNDNPMNLSIPVNTEVRLELSEVAMTLPPYYIQ